ncbi:unnamed protein product [Larinioides sclopetarius]|uniref:Uncharacterized protein n=1 Tax=Larinioides sclopetarius TaxID=280406 RepID=A0AAV1ZCZ9_9ARAC
MAGIFSGSLTTISSILNSLATVTVVDFVHPISQSIQKNEKKSLLLAKGFSLAYGAICICIALTLTKTNSLTQVGFLFHNTFDGPSLAIFTLGVLTRKGFGKSVLFCLLPGFIITQWIGFSGLLNGYNEPPLPLNTSMCASTFNLTHGYSTSEISNTFAPSNTPAHSSHSETFILNKISYFWIRPIGFVITLCITYIGISIIEMKRKRNKAIIPADSKYLSPLVRLWTKNSKGTEQLKENTTL